jgi:hypothetical protein
MNILISAIYSSPNVCVLDVSDLSEDDIAVLVTVADALRKNRA